MTLSKKQQALVLAVILIGCAALLFTIFRKDAPVADEARNFIPPTEAPATEEAAGALPSEVPAENTEPAAGQTAAAVPDKASATTPAVAPVAAPAANGWGAARAAAIKEAEEKSKNNKGLKILPEESKAAP